MSGPPFVVEYGFRCFWCGDQVDPGAEGRMYGGRAHCAEHDLDEEDQ